MESLKSERSDGVSQGCVWEDSDAAVTSTVVSGRGEGGSAMTVSCRDETMVWVFTHLFHLQICTSEGGP